MIRILGGGRVNKEIEACVLSTMNLLIRNPEMIQSPIPSPLDRTQHFRIQKELDMVMDRQPIDEDRASEIIKKAAEAEYDLLDSSEYETERLHRIFRSNTSMDELSADLLLKTVAEISVEIKEISYGNYELQMGGRCNKRLLFQGRNSSTRIQLRCEKLNSNKLR